jgi:hypothetical protein
MHGGYEYADAHENANEHWHAAAAAYDHNKWICGFECCMYELVCVGTAACPWTADVRACAPQAKIYRFVPFKKKKRFL